MFARIAFAVPAGVLVTAGLLFMMHMFVETGHGQAEAKAYRAVEFVRVERSETVETKTTRPEKPETQERAPALPEPDTTAAFGNMLAIAVTKPEVAFGADIGGPALAASDGEYLPIVKVAPIYPMRALQRRLEGYVVVEFIVSTSGAVRDVVVVESSSAVFESAAVEAALKFRYKPRVVDGIAIEVAGVQNRITFRLDT